MLPFAFNSAARPSLDLVRLVALLAGLALTNPVAAQVDMERMPDTTQSPPSSQDAPAAESAETEKRKKAAQPSDPQARAKILSDLYEQLAKSPNAATAAPIAEAIQRVWIFSGSDTTDLLMMRAQKAISEKKLDLALTMLNSIVELQPDFAEGWNRRAYVYFLKDDYERALGDIRRTLALEPKHFKALEGMANILRQLNNKKTALEALKKLLEIHPHADGIKTAIDELTREVEGQGI
jgi:tetratricopeptide (TPR) repeat protein